MRGSLIAVSIALVSVASQPAGWRARDRSPPLSVAYTLHVDAAHIDLVDVDMRIEHAPDTLRLAQKVHPEYDARYWRYLDALRVDGSADDRVARVVRLDSTLWKVVLPGGRGVVHYRVHVQAPSGAVRRAWMPFMRQTGGLVNSPDFFLYLPDFADTPASVTLDIPRQWRVATALEPSSTPARYTAPNAATLLDTPILLGELREWSFTDRGTGFHVVYWPLPDAAPFDTAALVDEVRRLAHSALDVFGRAPTREYYVLLQDGADDALEHRASVTFGLESAALARDPRASLTELAHEFFHTWNLVAIHPDAYGELSYRPPARTTGLWWGEGVTLYYADALSRRAGLVDTARSRLDHLAQLLVRYYAAPWGARVSPERASLAFDDSPLTNADATGGYYLQGELLGNELDALIRDSTRDARGMDDVMRALFAASGSDAGFTSTGLERVVDSVCGCRLDRVFAQQVRGASLIDVAPVVGRLGLRAVADSAPAVDSLGRPLPDLRLGIDFTQTGGPLRLVVSNPASAWSIGGLRTGDLLRAIDATPVTTFSDMQRVLHTLHIGDTVAADVQRGGRPVRVVVFVAGFVTPRVRFADLATVTAEQRSRRARWLAGW